MKVMPFTVYKTPNGIFSGSMFHRKMFNDVVHITTSLPRRDYFDGKLVRKFKNGVETLVQYYSDGRFMRFVRRNKDGKIIKTVSIKRETVNGKSVITAKEISVAINQKKFQEIYPDFKGEINPDYPITYRFFKKIDPKTNDSLTMKVVVFKEKGAKNPDCVTLYSKIDNINNDAFLQY